MIVAFTGHRPDKLGGYSIPNPQYNRIVAHIERALKDLSPTKAISGMSLGVDLWAAQCCINMNIPFIAAVPFIGQESIWPEKSKDEYTNILTKAIEVKIVCPGGYAGWKMQKRNEWMVENCDKLLAIWDGSHNGGTYNCIKYAEKIGKDIIYIAALL